jgi:hypothetical protein
MFRVALVAPGFDDGALLAYHPSKCASPFPNRSGGGCPHPDGLHPPRVTLDTSRARQSWTFSATCDVPAQGQAASWTGTVTVLRTAASASFSPLPAPAKPQRSSVLLVRHRSARSPARVRSGRFDRDDPLTASEVAEVARPARRCGEKERCVVPSAGNTVA